MSATFTHPSHDFIRFFTIFHLSLFSSLFFIKILYRLPLDLHCIRDEIQILGSFAVWLGNDVLPTVAMDTDGIKHHFFRLPQNLWPCTSTKYMSTSIMSSASPGVFLEVNSEWLIQINEKKKMRVAFCLRLSDSDFRPTPLQPCREYFIYKVHRWTTRIRNLYSIKDFISLLDNDHLIGDKMDLSFTSVHITQCSVKFERNKWGYFLSKLITDTLHYKHDYSTQLTDTLLLADTQKPTSYCPLIVSHWT